MLDLSRGSDVLTVQVGLGFRQGRVGDLAIDVDLDDPVDDVVARLLQFGACLARDVVEALNEEALLVAQRDAWQEDEARVEAGSSRRRRRRRGPIRGTRARQ